MRSSQSLHTRLRSGLPHAFAPQPGQVNFVLLAAFFRPICFERACSTNRIKNVDLCTLRMFECCTNSARPISPCEGRLDTCNGKLHVCNQKGQQVNVRRKLAVLAANLLFCAGCTTQSEFPPLDLRQYYENAIREAVVRRPEFAVPLRSISSDRAMVSVATFTEWGVPSTPLTRNTWVSLPEQLHELCHGKPDSILAIQQILGLPPMPTPSRPDHQWAVVMFTVPRDKIFRPCPGGTDIAAPRCSAEGVASNLNDTMTRFFLSQIWNSDRIGFTTQGNGTVSFQDFGYPFTGMGWSYDWNPASPTHIGVSEYVVSPGASVKNVSSMSPDQFCSGRTAPTS
jgi:hypothetical protein